MTAVPPFFHGRDEVCHNLFALVPCQEQCYPLCLPPPDVPDLVLPVDQFQDAVPTALLHKLTLFVVGFVFDDQVLVQPLELGPTPVVELQWGGIQKRRSFVCFHSCYIDL